MVSTRSSKDLSPALQSQDSDTRVESPPSSQTRSPTTGSNRKRRRSGRKNGSHSPSSGADSPKSDTSTREKMRKTKIEESGEPLASQTESSQEPNDEMVDVQAGEVSPGGKGRKRTHDEIATGSKEAKPVTTESEIRPPSRAANGEPVGKKLRETPSPPREVTENISTADQPATPKQDVALTSDDKAPAKEEADEKPKQEYKEEPKKEPTSKLGGGFLNTSSVSPFGSLATKSTKGKSTEEKSTETSNNASQSAFAASKFSSFASVTSAFGVSPTPLAPSPFGGPPTGSDNVFSKMSSAATTSVFPAPPTGSANIFAKMSGSTNVSGFGATASPFGSGVSIFGNPLSSKPLPKAQPLEGISRTVKNETSETNDSENGDDDEENSRAGDASEAGNTKSTVFAPKVVIKSGEEDYDPVFQARAKLFELSNGAWKERGIGNIRVLTPKHDFELEDHSNKPSVGRIVMRQEGVGRLILNTNIFKNMLVAGKPISDNTIRFLAVNSVTFGEARDDNVRDDNDQTETKEKENNGANEKSASDAGIALATKPVLKTYLLRFKGADLVDGFKDNIEANMPA